MTLPTLTSEIAYRELQAFFTAKPFVLFGTGVSCAVDIAYGMGALESHLKAVIPSLTSTDKQSEEWRGVLAALESDLDFEAAMNSIEDGELLQNVILQTAEHVTCVDREKVNQVLNGAINWSAIRMFSRLVERLPEDARTLHVATPNYDLLAEYAFTRARIAYTTGFWGGVIRELDWLQAERQMTYADTAIVGKKKRTVTRCKKHIRLYKVHGSLNTFISNGQVVETDAWSEVPNDVERLLITPGTSKHEKLHDYRDALLSEFDRAVNAHSSFLFLGFGFNDSQLVNNSIGDKLKVQDSSALIITRSSNERIESMLRDSKNTWLVCKPADGSGTRIYNQKFSNALILSDKEIWRFDDFVTEILGD